MITLTDKIPFSHIKDQEMSIAQDAAQVMRLEQEKKNEIKESQAQLFWP